MGSTREAFGRRVKARFGTAHLVAVVAGLLTALLLLSWTRGQDQVVPVLVAAEDIRAGALLDAADVRMAEITADSPVVPALLSGTELDSLSGQVATRSIAADEPILRSDVRPVVAEGGRRAMSFSVPQANAVGGDLVVGDEVDVLVVSDEGTRFVAENVPVLALPQSVESGLAAAASSWWVVLAVEDIDALEIADGVENGTIYLLRSTGTPALSVKELEPPDDTTGDPPEAAAGAEGR